MKIIVCLDDHNGMMFNRRRQSQDRLLRADILRLCQGRNLYLNAYSHSLFQKKVSSSENNSGFQSAPDFTADISFSVSEDFLLQAGQGDFCFVENWADVLAAAETDSSFFNRLEAVLVYHWNRTYPADTYFTLDLTDANWELTERDEFTGSSHEKITRELYQKRAAN